MRRERSELEKIQILARRAVKVLYNLSYVIGP